MPRTSAPGWRPNALVRQAEQQHRRRSWTRAFSVPGRDASIAAHRAGGGGRLGPLNGMVGAEQPRKSSPVPHPGSTSDVLDEGSLHATTSLRGACLGILMMAALVQGAAADPSGAKKNLAFTATCDGQQVDFVVNGNGDFTPGHVVAAPRSSSSKPLPSPYSSPHREGRPRPRLRPGSSTTRTGSW